MNNTDKKLVGPGQDYYVYKFSALEAEGALLLMVPAGSEEEAREILRREFVDVQKSFNVEWTDLTLITSGPAHPWNERAITGLTPENNFYTKYF